MKANSRATALLLVFALLVAVPAVWGLEFSATTAGHPAGCHDSMPEHPAPVPDPASHQCCAGGHSWAVTVPTLILTSVVELARTRLETYNFRPYLFKNPSVIFISDSPPATASLRI